MEDQLEIVVTCDLKIRVKASELEEAYGTKSAPDIVTSTVSSLTPTADTPQTALVNRWIVDNEPEFDVMGVQAIWI